MLATANPIEYEGTYPLPEAQLDRFLLRVSFGYPEPDEEWEVLRRRMTRRQEEAVLEPVVDAETLLAMQGALEDVSVEDSIGRYIVVARRGDPLRTRRSSSAPRPAARSRCCCSPGPPPRSAAATTSSPRTSRRSPCRRCRTASRCCPEMWLKRIDPRAVVGEVLAQTPAPASGALPTYGGRRG